MPSDNSIPGVDALANEQAQQRSDTAAQTQQQFQQIQKEATTLKDFPGGLNLPYKTPVPMPDFGHPIANHVFTIMQKLGRGRSK